MMAAPDSSEGLWLTVSDLARLRGVDKALISRQVARFEAEGLMVTRAGPRDAKLVNAAEYDRLAGQHLDATKMLGSRLVGRGGGPILSREQARRVAYQADLARLELGERTRKLVPMDRLEDEARRLIEPVVKVLDRLPSRVDDIVAAHNEGGVHGVRACLKDISKQVRNEVAKALSDLAFSLSAEPRRAVADFDPSVPSIDTMQPTEN